MCIIVVALAASRRYPLMIAANRDERHARPAAAANWWDDQPDVLAGRDLAAGGTWLGISATGRVAAVTNIFEAGRAAAPSSRGRLVSDFLAGGDAPADYAAKVAAEGHRYGPFNLLLYAANKARGDGPDQGAAAVGLADGATLVHVSNRNAGGPLAPGLHVFGNNAPGEDWPKLERARAGMRGRLEQDAPEEALLEVLAERGALPGRSPRDSIFVLGPEFGTRSSSVVLLDADGRAVFVERRFGPDGARLGTSRFEFPLALR